MTASPFNIGHKCATKQLEHVHSDLCRELEHLSLGGNRFFATLIDDMSGMIWIHPLKHKGDFVDWFIKMDSTFANQYGRHIGILWANNGGEYTNQCLQDYCDHHGILLEYTIPHTPQQNGVTERANQTLTKRMRVMMKDMDCPTALWGEAVCTAAYCLNCIPTSANGGITLIQAFDGTTPDISVMTLVNHLTMWPFHMYIYLRGWEN